MSAPYPSGVYTIGDLRVDVGRRIVTRGHEELKLGKLTFDLLVTLADHAPNLVTHNEVAESVWPGRPVSAEVIAQRLKILRKALCDHADHPQYIRVIRGLGYQLIPPVHVLHAAEQSAPAIREAADTDAAPATVVTTRAAALTNRRPLLLLVIAMAVGGSVAGWSSWNLKPETLVPNPVTRFIHPIPESQEPSNSLYNPIAISPDGRRLAYTTSNGLFLRDLRDLEPRLIVETDYDRLRGPFFSPDGQSIAYTDIDQGSTLKRITIDNGTPMSITEDCFGTYGAVWGLDPAEIFCAVPEGIHRISAPDGVSELIISAQEGEMYGTPQLLPDGDTLLFAVSAIPDTDDGSVITPYNWNNSEIVAQSLRSGERTPLIHSGSHARYLNTGHIVYAFENTLRSVAFDVASLTVQSAPVSVISGIERGPQRRPYAYYDVSYEGTLIYMRDGYLEAYTVPIWIDRELRQQKINAAAGTYWYGQLSPDGERIVFQKNDADAQVWVHDMQRGNSQRVVMNDQGLGSPIWVDDDRIAFRPLGPTSNIFMTNADGSGTAVQLTDFPMGAGVPTDVSPDGSTLIFSRIAPMNAGVWTVSLEDNSDGSKPLLDSPAQEWNATFSPDGRWIAYQSDESGRFEVFVRPYPDVHSGRIKISDNGGTHPVWSKDGAELYYLALPQSESGMYGEVFQTLRTGTLMAVPITTGSGFLPQVPRPLFDNVFVAPGWMHHAYDVSPDGRFLMLQRDDDSSTKRGIVIVENWIEELRTLVPAE